MERVITYYYDNIICEKFYKLNNKIHGEYNSFYNTGEPEIISYYNEGKIDGLFIRIYKNGLIEEKTFYRNGMKDGDCVKFYEDGIIKEKSYFVNNRYKYIILYNLDGSINKQNCGFV
jgi:antitoxin component YwqK of YwqJK toxin-antitoxin module